jgi:hypothetical protein
LSDGRSRRIALVPARTIAEIYADLLAALKALDVDVTLSPIPQEVADVTPLDTDAAPGGLRPGGGRNAGFAVVTATAAASSRPGARTFSVRSGIQLWWGALDLSLMLFNGKHVPIHRPIAATCCATISTPSC